MGRLVERPITRPKWSTSMITSFKISDLVDVRDLTYDIKLTPLTSEVKKHLGLPYEDNENEDIIELTGNEIEGIKFDSIFFKIIAKVNYFNGVDIKSLVLKEVVKDNEGNFVYPIERTKRSKMTISRYLAKRLGVEYENGLELWPHLSNFKTIENNKDKNIVPQLADYPFNGGQTEVISNIVVSLDRALQENNVFCCKYHNGSEGQIVGHKYIGLINNNPTYIVNCNLTRMDVLGKNLSDIIKVSCEIKRQEETANNSLLDAFLIKNNLTNKFIYELKRAGGDSFAERYLKIHSNDRDAILCAFSWADSSLGRTYWLDVEKKWYEFYKQRIGLTLKKI